jgi:hypothetical protein
MDETLGKDTERKLHELTENPDMDLHLRVQEHRIEGFVWVGGRRYRLVGVRDEEGSSDQGSTNPASEGPGDGQ